MLQIYKKTKEKSNYLDYLTRYERMPSFIYLSLQIVKG